MNAERVWLDSYPEGVPADIDASQYDSLVGLMADSFAKHANRTAYSYMGQDISYSRTDVTSQALAAYFQSLGLEKGDRVAIMMPNVPQYPVAVAAILRAGLVVVNVNPLYTPRELEHQLKDSGAKAIVIIENFAITLQKCLVDTQVKHVVLCAMGDMLSWPQGALVNFVVRNVKNLVPSFDLPGANRFNAALSLSQGAQLQEPDLGPEDLAVLQYTGGTTGLSKGAVLTHRNIVAAILQAETWFAPALERLPDLRKVNSIAALPLYHIFALTLCFLAIRQGSHMTLVPNPRDFGKFIETLKKRPFHMLPGVNTLFNALMQHPLFKSVDFSNLCLTQAGGMAASEGTARAWQAATGSAMIEGWGMSETCAIGTNNPVTRTSFSGNIGLPLPSIELAIKDDAGNSLPQGESGEICIRGPNVMVGYYKQEEETRKAFTPDGYMRTGDVGIMDEEGYFRIVDRKKDMIIVSGFNVFPSELENVISMCPGVIECAAIGIPDSMQGEVIKVFVVRSDSMLTEDAVARYCHDNLTGYKRPKYIEFRDELPKSNVGKILRRELRSNTH